MLELQLSACVLNSTCNSLIASYNKYILSLSSVHYKEYIDVLLTDIGAVLTSVMKSSNNNTE